MSVPDRFPLRTFAMPRSLRRRVFFAELEPIPQIAKQPGRANFALADKCSLLSRLNLSRPKMSRLDYVEGDTHRSRARMANERSRRGCFLFRSIAILALHPLSTCSSFRAKSSKMSATGHCACLPREKGAACDHAEMSSSLREAAIVVTRENIGRFRGLAGESTAFNERS